VCLFYHVLQRNDSTDARSVVAQVGTESIQCGITASKKQVFAPLRMTILYLLRRKGLAQDGKQVSHYPVRFH